MGDLPGRTLVRAAEAAFLEHLWLHNHSSLGRKATAVFVALPDGNDPDREFLDQLISVTTASVVICYSLYTLDSRTVTEFGTRNLVFTVPFVIYGIFRYLFLVHRRQGGGSPATALLSDPSLAINTLLWLGATTVILYG